MNHLPEVRCHFIVLLCILGLASCGPSTPAPPGPLDTVSFTISGKTFITEIADNDASREYGLMKRASLPEERGMVFVFQQPGVHHFWMKDTWIDLDVIWLDSRGAIIFMATMKAGDQKEQGPAGDSQYIIELSAGMAKTLNLHAGDILSIPPKILQPSGK